MRILNLSLLFLIGCGGPAPSKVMPDMMPARSLGTPPALAIACRDAPADLYTLPTNLPAMDDTHRGDVFHCAPGESLTTSWANTQATSFGYVGPSLATGFWTYRIAYRSLRNTPTTGAPAEGDMVAVLLVPEKPLPGAPLVVVAHPTMGLGPSCGPSHIDLSDPKQKNDYTAATIPLAAYGYTVIIPDYAGYSYGQAPGYFNAEDEGHAVLDATRAATHVLPSSRAFSKVVFVGHSQGGHAAIAAETMAASYGHDGQLVGVATWAPFWTSMAAWGAIPAPIAGYDTKSDGYAILYSMFYFYSGAELRDGPGSGTSMFQPAKQAAAKQVILSDTCFDVTDLQTLGMKPTDFYDNTFVTQVGTMCATGTDCTQGDAPKWLARWKQDRPHLDPMGPPMLVWYAGMDTFVAPQYAQCARQRFAADLNSAGATTTVSVCYDPNATHGNLPRTSVDYVNKWIAARAGIGSDPAACAPFPTGISCLTPPNDY